MTKGELFRALEGLMDETEVVVWSQSAERGELDILRAAYVPSRGEMAAFVHLVARSALTQ